MADFVLEFLNFFTVELNNFFAVLADDVVMVWVMGIIRIIEFVILAEIHFSHQSTFRKQRKRAINRRAGN